LSIVEDEAPLATGGLLFFPVSIGVKTGKTMDISLFIVDILKLDSYDM